MKPRPSGDATPQELEISEVNAGIYAFDGGALVDALGQIRADNAQGEYYLPDVLPIIRRAGMPVTALRVQHAIHEIANVNDRVQLSEVTALAQAQINRAHMLNGATIIDPAGTVIDVQVELGTDVTILPGTALRGLTTVGDGSEIGPHTTLTDVTVGEDSRVVHSYGVNATIESRVTVGPFAYLRPGTVLRDGAKAGTFVEIKNSDVGARTKVPHLSYIGDATIGEDTNLGAATITANYDGVNKHRTTIGSRVHTSVDTTLVAPVTVGDDAYTGAGSVITDDVPDGSLGIARARQSNVDGYAERVRERAQADAGATVSEKDH